MDQRAQPTPIVRFDVFEFDPRACELRRLGLKVKVQEQPFQVLTLLLDEPGHLVSRAELQRAIWPDGTFVDFDSSINKAINRLREILGDSAESPRFIETVPKRGYRFIAPVETVRPDPLKADDEAAALPPHLQPPALPAPPAWRRSHLWRLVGAAAVLAVVAMGLGRWSRAPNAAHTAGALAVLPLENLSGDPGQEYFADGMTDELITSLGRISDLRVISRTSVMRYKTGRKPLSEIARELGVDSVVEGSVLRAGRTVRMTVRLLRATDDRQLWSERYDRELGDLVELQRQIAQAITRQVHARLSLSSGAVIGGSRPVNLEAYEAYLKGRYLWNRRTEADLHTSITYFERAIHLDPQYALAYAGLADAYILIGIFGLQPSDQAFPNAREAAEKALALDETLAEAHTALAEVRKDYDWDWKGAERGYRRAIELNGNDSTAHHFYAHLLAVLGRHQEAMAEIEEARHVDPLSPPINAYVAYIYLLAGQDGRAVSEGRQAVALDPQFALAHFDLGRAYLQQRRMAEAAAELELGSRLSGGTGMFDAELAFAYARAGNRDGALVILHDLKGRGPTRYVSPFDVAVVYTGLGDKPAALDALERAYETRVMRMTALSDPEFAELHGEPRFRQLFERMGLPITGQ